MDVFFLWSPSLVTTRISACAWRPDGGPHHIEKRKRTWPLLSAARAQKASSRRLRRCGFARSTWRDAWMIICEQARVILHVVFFPLFYAKDFFPFCQRIVDFIRGWPLPATAQHDYSILFTSIKNYLRSKI